MGDSQLDSVRTQIEALRNRLNAAIEASHGDLHAPIVQALSKRIDEMIAGLIDPRVAAAAQPGAESGPRRSGIDAVGDIPWGTHFCQFYGTREDLVNTLVSYFKVGLEDRELCIWVVSDPVSVDEAEEALRRSVRSLSAYLKSGQLQIIQDTEWYYAGGAFDPRSVADAWLAKLNDALLRGYEGMRVAGHPGGRVTQRGDWTTFIDYEGMVNTTFGGRRILALCGYALNICGACETADAVRNHGFTLLEHEGAWQAV